MLRQYVGLACKTIGIPRHYRAPPNLSRCFSTESNGPSAPLVYPEPPSAHHSSLESFLAYAERWQLDRASTVYVGTLYEYTIAKSLERYGFHLRRVGGASDYGIDLLGEWKPPSTSTTLRVLIQCKGGAQRVGPNLIRELEGAFVGAPAGWRGQGVLGLMVAQRPATKGVRDSLGRSRWPMGYLFCEAEGEVKQMIWNRRAEEEGLEGFGVTTRHVESKADPELALMKQGKLLPLVTTNG
ncbi:uncharacterized protein F5Z01DRAFT_30511 [Emericellopsis atlantica]|uniref:Uncharacterized protein n=1 Tax=Emericellopsis atlantica TaxID=2614577 RepID=A0A9P8CUK3_9HYPO|nr:uncharacterized protein F5Z01DRAFT_30511 [Emericellopsis atlantica]KAG9259227.1 hypothetical protein F5Z01DRAFT_30511 [Emericellopsis atlantica]